MDNRRFKPPFDTRLWSNFTSVKKFVSLSVSWGILSAIEIIIFAYLLAKIISERVNNNQLTGLASWKLEIIFLVALILLRFLTEWERNRYVHRATKIIVLDLRLKLISSLKVSDPRILVKEKEYIKTLLIAGLEKLPPYFTDYLPALFLAAITTPLIWLAIFLADKVSALIIAITIPLLPIFMILIGYLTENRTRDLLIATDKINTLSEDLVAGMPTIINLGRNETANQAIKKSSLNYYKKTIQSLRIAFLSGGVLEVLTTLCVALVAASLGFRLLGYLNQVSLINAIFVLILVAEVYKPLRNVGMAFHASEDGQYAVDQVFELITKISANNLAEKNQLNNGFTLKLEAPLEVSQLSIKNQNSSTPYKLSFTANPGQIIALTGDNGAGKSTSFYSILGIAGVTPNGEDVTGEIKFNDRSISSFSQEELWNYIGWLPQRPTTVAGTIGENVGLNSQNITEVEKVASKVGFLEVVNALPERWDSLLGNTGFGLSLGQRQRLMLTKIFTQDKKIFLLDEPTAHLDKLHKQQVIEYVQELASQTKTFVVISHDAAWLKAADETIVVQAKND